MFQVRRADERGHANHGWLDTYHTFSFADYDDPAYRSFRALRVINEDWVQPGHGFGMHGHREMEIVTYVLSGALEHRDSLGNGEVLHPGELQRMSAGTGIRHSEFNPSSTELVHLYQIWILPSVRGLSPSYEQRPLPPADPRTGWRLLAAADGAGAALTIHADARIALANLSPGQSATYDLAPGRHAWLQVVRGPVDVGGLQLHTSDGLAVSDEASLTIAAADDAEVLLFDLA